MKKRIAAVGVIAALALAAVLTGCTKAEEPKAEKVVLTMGSWRADDVDAWTQLLAEYEKTSGVLIQFKPVNPPDYNASLRLQLDNGTGPDLMFARSYATGAELFDKGFFADVTDLPGLQSNFSESSKDAWRGANGRSFAVPVAAVAQSIFYNKDIFEKEGIAVPATWEELLTACQKLQAAGYIPFANGLADEWDINECFMMGLIPNFIGGEKGRLAYEKGDRPFNDEAMVAAFAAMRDVAPYCPQGFEALTYNDSNALFATGKAAMYADGSWTLDSFKDIPFNWGNIAFPPPAGMNPEICFHVDMGIAMNANGKHQAEARAFLEWLCKPEGVAVVAKYLPNGFYPMFKGNIPIENAHSAELYALLQGKGQDVRFVWPKLMNGNPSGYNLLNEGVIAVMKGQKTPKEAADALADGLAQWYKPE
ncbi:MAG: extracellular solute-binding protein [Treponema sp.]